MSVEHTWVAGDRWYLDNNTGNKVPGVSAILDIISKPAIDGKRLSLAAEFAVENVDTVARVASADLDAAKTLVRDAAKREWKRRSDGGTNVHTLCEHLMKDKRDGLKSTFPVSPDEMKFLKNFARFTQEFEVAPIFVEQTVWSIDHDYAGQLDLGAWITVDGERVLADIDTKTGASGVWPEAAIQQTAYIHADHIVDDDGSLVEWPAEKPTRAFALWLRPNGWALIPLDTGTSTWDEFLRRRGSYEWRLHNEKSAVGKAINQNPLRRQWRGGKS